MGRESLPIGGPPRLLRPAFQPVISCGSASGRAAAIHRGKHVNATPTEGVVRYLIARCPATGLWWRDGDVRVGRNLEHAPNLGYVADEIGPNVEEQRHRADHVGTGHGRAA